MPYCRRTDRHAPMRNMSSLALRLFARRAPVLKPPISFCTDGGTPFPFIKAFWVLFRSSRANSFQPGYPNAFETPLPTRATVFPPSRARSSILSLKALRFARASQESGYSMGRASSRYSAMTHQPPRETGLSKASNGIDGTSPDISGTRGKVGFGCDGGAPRSVEDPEPLRRPLSGRREGS